MRTVLTLSADDLAHGTVKLDALVPKRSLMDANSINDLQNYPVGVSATVDYFRLLTAARERNNQPGVDPRPIDFIAVRVPAQLLRDALDDHDQPDSDAVWLYAADDRQVLILARKSGPSLRYLPVRALKQDAAGRITFERQPLRRDLSLRYFEDAALDATGVDWLNAWHTEDEWFRATHRTRYWNGIVGYAALPSVCAP